MKSTKKQKNICRNLTTPYMDLIVSPAKHYIILPHNYRHDITQKHQDTQRITFSETSLRLYNIT